MKKHYLVDTNVIIKTGLTNLNKMQTNALYIGISPQFVEVGEW